jgi:two-component system LytT family response regulator
MIQGERANLFFLDVQIPALDGLRVVEPLVPESCHSLFSSRLTISTPSAHFEANALDYLLKPFSDERFETALARAKSLLNERNFRELGQRMLEMASKLPPGAPGCEVRRHHTLSESHRD